MHYLYIVIIIMICIMAYKQERNLYNPVILFGGVWALAMLLSGMQLYDLNETSTYAYTLALIGVIFFSLGAFSRNRVRIRARRIVGVNTELDYKINFKFLLVFYTPTLVFVAYLASISIALLARGVSMETIRFNYNNVEAGIVIKNQTAWMIENYIVQAAIFASIALIPIVTAYENSVKKYVLLFELITLNILYIFVSGARSFIINIALLFIVYLLMNKALAKRFREYFDKIPRFLIILIIVAGLGVVAYMTTMRKGEDRGYLHEIYRYISIAFPLFDTRIKMLDMSHTYTYGWTLLHGFLKTPFYILLRLTKIPFPAGLSEAVSQIAANNNFYYVGGGNANSFVTVFYYMMMDFGVIGVPIESFLYGYFCQSRYKLVTDNPNRRSQAIYLLVAIGLLLSFVRLFFSAHRYVNAFIILFLSFVANRDGNNPDNLLR